MNPTSGSLRYHDGDGGEKRYLKSDFIKRSRILLELNSVKISMFKKRRRNPSSLIYVLHRKRNYVFLRRRRAATPKKCIKKCAARAKLFFLVTQSYSFSYVVGAVADVTS